MLVGRTGSDVIENLGSADGIDEQALAPRHETNCDPRLNPKQSVALVFLVAKTLQA